MSSAETRHLERSIGSRQLTMIAIGGAIGTGLFFASGSAISQAGPGGAMLAYSIMAVAVYCIMQYTATAMIEYASIAPPGPAWEIAEPLAKNRPVPIAPPIAIMVSWREPMLPSRFRVLALLIWSHPHGSKPGSLCRPHGAAASEPAGCGGRVCVGWWHRSTCLLLQDSAVSAMASE